MKTLIQATVLSTFSHLFWKQIFTITTGVFTEDCEILLVADLPESGKRRGVYFLRLSAAEIEWISNNALLASNTSFLFQ